MSIFRRLFKSFAPGAPGQAPGSGSGSGQGLLPSSKHEPESARASNRSKVQRSPRVQLLPLHGVTFHVDEPVGFGHLPVWNLSVDGIGFLESPESGAGTRTRWPVPGSAGSRLNGKLMIRSEEFPVQVTLVHAGPSRAGGRFEDPTPEFQRRINEHFLTEFAALKLTSIKRDLLQDDPDGEPLFFVGENNSELFVVVNQGKVIHFHLCFFGNVIDGSKDGKLTAGTLDDEGFSDGGPGHKSAALVRKSRVVSDELATIAIRFLSNVRQLDPALRDQIETRLRDRV